MYQATSIGVFGEEVLGYAYAALAVLEKPSSALVTLKEPYGSPHPCFVISVNGELQNVKVPGEFEVIRTRIEVASYVRAKIAALFKAP